MNSSDGAKLYLREWRKRRKLTQQALRAATGLSPTTISTIENGHTQRIDFETLARLARALGVDAACLFAKPGASLHCR